MSNLKIQQILIKRGNTAAASDYVGPLGELLVDTGLQTLRLQDGVTPGGMSTLATTQQLSNVIVTIEGIQSNTANISALLANVHGANITGITSNVTTLQSYFGSNGTATIGNLNVNQITFTNNSKIWEDGDGQIQFGANGQNDSTGLYFDNSGVAVVYANTAVQILSGQSTTNYTNETWTFDQYGNLTLPGNVIFADSTVQGTAYQGPAGQTSFATTGYVDTANSYVQTYTTNSISAAINNLINSAPGTLDTLGEIAANLAQEGSAIGAITNSITNINANVTVANAEIATLQTQVYTNANASAYLSTYLPTYTGNLTAGNLVVSGNINYLGAVNYVTGQTGQFQGNAAGFGALYAGILSGFTYQPQTTLQISSNFNGYAQINSQNINSGALASSDFIATADNGTATTGYIDMGIASSTYNYPGFGIIKPNDGYLLVTGGTGTGGGNLILTTGTANDIVFAPNGTEFARINSAGNFIVNGNLFVGSSNIVSTIASLQSNAAIQETEITGLRANITSANAAIQTLNANIGAYETWANLHFGTSTYSNTNVAAYISANPVTTSSLVNGSYTFALQGQGYLTVPTSQYGTAQMFSSAGVPLYIGTLDSGNYWQFKTGGVLQFPDNSQQTTAYTGFGNANVAAYLAANPQGSTYSNANVASYFNSSSQYTFGNATPAVTTQANAFTILIGNVAGIHSGFGNTLPNATVISDNIYANVSGTYVYRNSGQGAATITMNNGSISFNGTSTTGNAGAPASTSTILNLIPSLGVYAYLPITLSAGATSIQPSGLSSTTFSFLTSGVNTFNGLTAAYNINLGAGNVTLNLGSGTGNITAGNITATHYGNAIGTTATYTGNVTATGNLISNNFLFPNGVSILSTVAPSSTYSNSNVSAYLTTTSLGSLNALSATFRNGDPNPTYANPQITFGYNGTTQYPHFIHTVHNAGSGVSNAINFYTSDGTQNGVFPTNGVIGLTVSNGQVGIGNTLGPQYTLDVTGNARVTNNIIGANFLFANGVNILSTVSGGNGTYSNSNVASYLLTYGGNITTANIFFPSTSYIDFNNTDKNWRMGYSLGAYTKTTAQTTLDVVVGQGSSGPDGFTVGQTGGASIFELNGYTRNAWFANNVNTVGNITAGNVLATGYFFANGTPFTSSNYGNTQVAAYLAANPQGSTYSNTNVAAYLTTASITTTGNISAGNINGNQFGNSVGTTATYSGNVSANYFVGNGSALTGLTYNNVGNIYGSSSNVTLVAGTYSYTFDNTGNLVIPGGGDIVLSNATSTITMTGNIYTGNVFASTYSYANGVSILTGIGGTYSNANVASYLVANPITTVANGSSSLGFATSGGNAVVQIGGVQTATISQSQINVVGNVIASANITAANIVTTGATSGNISGANYISANAFQVSTGIFWANGTAWSSAGGGTTYSNTNVAAYLTTASITTTGNITAPYILGNTVGNSYGNISGTTGTFTGNVTAGNIIANQYGNSIGTTATYTGNVTAGNISATQVTATTGAYSGNITAANIITTGTYGNITNANVITANTFVGSGSQLTGVATQATGSWTLTTGTNNVSFTVPGGYTYSTWVNGNVPNGIVVYTATVVVTNTNVPVIGSQYGWYYSAGNALVLTSMPTQVIGTSNVISTSAPVVSNANVFSFTIINNSGSSQVVNWGYTKL